MTLFFIADDDDLLHKETREIAAGPTEADEAERALAELIKGSEKGLVSPLPPADPGPPGLHRQGRRWPPSISAATSPRASPTAPPSELAAVYAVVNTLVFNFKPVKKVVLLVEGAERETLGGHVDLSRAFFPDYSLVAR